MCGSSRLISVRPGVGSFHTAFLVLFGALTWAANAAAQTDGAWTGTTAAGEAFGMTVAGSGVHSLFYTITIPGCFEVTVKYTANAIFPIAGGSFQNTRTGSTCPREEVTGTFQGGSAATGTISLSYGGFGCFCNGSASTTWTAAAPGAPPPPPPHTLAITAGPQGTPNPVPSAGNAAMAVSVQDSLAHGLNYAWTSTCASLNSSGTFSNAQAASPSWTAPANTSDSTQQCTIGVTVTDGAGLSASKSFQQGVSPEHKVTITAGPNGVPNPVESGGVVALSVSAGDTLGHALTYAWSASCPGLPAAGSFNNLASPTPTWAAPANASGTTRTCRLSVQVGDNAGSTRDAGFDQLVRSDSDSDGIPDDWETSLGLNSASAEGIDGPAGDPDGDGLTNIEELRNGTHPRGFFVRYFAEGAASAFFDTSLALLNTGADVSHVLLGFQRSDGTVVSRTVSVAPHARATVNPKEVSGLESAAFSVLVESDLSVVADRTMMWDGSGYGAHAETSVAAPLTTWYLAEGATHSGFQLFYLIQNANASAATVDVRFLRPAPAPPVIRTYVVGPRSRANIWVNTEPELTATDVSAVVTSSIPIIVERAMYLDRPGEPFAAGHESAAIAAPSREWFLAEGATGTYFDLFILVANPNNVSANLNTKYLLPNGDVVNKSYQVAPNSRFNIWVDAEGGVLADTAVSTQIVSDIPVLVERAMWWPGPTAAQWAEAHNSAGVTSTGTKWALAEGEQGGAHSKETYILIANTSAFDGQAKVTLYFEDGSSAERVVLIAANSRTNVAVGAPAAAGGFGSSAENRRFGAVVETLPTPAGPAEIVVERAMYSNAGDVVWAAGTNAVATRLE